MPNISIVAVGLSLLTHLAVAAEYPKDFDARLRSLAVACNQGKTSECDAIHSDLSIVRERFCAATMADVTCRNPLEELDCPKERYYFKLSYNMRLHPLEQKCTRGDTKACQATIQYLLPFTSQCGSKLCCHQAFADTKISALKETACKHGNQEECMRVGLDREDAASAMLVANGSEQALRRYQEALVQYKQACDRGLKSACQRYSLLDKEQYLRVGDGLERLGENSALAGAQTKALERFDEALSYYQKSCAQGVKQACGRFQRLSQNKAKLAKDVNAVESRAGHDCRTGILLGCVDLGAEQQTAAASAMQEGRKSHSRKLTSEAKTLYQKACKGKLWQGCEALSRLLTAENHSDQAIQYAEQAKSLRYQESGSPAFDLDGPADNNESSGTLGMASSGEALRTQVAMACKLGNFYACDRVAGFESESKLRIRCGSGDNAACFELANYLTFEPTSAESAQVLFLACSRGLNQACERLNVNYPVALRAKVHAKTDTAAFAKSKLYELTLDNGKKINITGRFAIESWDSRHPNRLFFAQPSQPYLTMVNLRDGKTFSQLLAAVSSSKDGRILASYVGKDWGFCGPPDVDPEFAPDVTKPLRTHVKVFELLQCDDKAEPWCQIVWTQKGIGEGVTEIAWADHQSLALAVSSHSCADGAKSTRDYHVCRCDLLVKSCSCALR